MHKVLRERLEQRGRGSQTALAHHLNVVPQTVNKWVKGFATPEMERWPAIEEFLALPPGTLAELAGVMPLDADLPGNVPPSIAALFQQLSDEIAALRSEVAALQTSVSARRRSSPQAQPQGPPKS